MSIPFQELAGSPTESYGPEGMRAERRLLVDYENRLLLIRELFGNSYEFGGATAAQYPGRAFVKATRITAKPWQEVPGGGTFNDVETNLATYAGKKVLLTVTYKLQQTTGWPNIEPPEGSFFTYRQDLGGEYKTLPGFSFHWASGIRDAIGQLVPVAPEALPTVRRPVTEHQISWHRVVRPPWTAMRQWRGYVNSVAFMGAPAETVLFEGATAEREFISFGDLEYPEFGWRIMYVFREKSIYDAATKAYYGWNHTYRGKPQNSPGWDRLVDNAGNFPYRTTANLGQLFEFAAIAE